jgi:membrane fusion protein, multidrug efflux system
MNRSRLKIVLPLAFLALAVVVAVALVQARPVAKKEERRVEPPLVRVLTVQPADVAVTVTSQGSIRSRAETTLVAQVGGKIESVSPAFGSGGTFAGGSVLARLDSRDHQVALSQAEAALAQARLRLARENAEAEIAREEWNRLGGGPANPLAVREPQLAEARAAVAAAEASVMQARMNIERTAIRAPYDGVLLEKIADVGQFVGPGTPVARVAASDFAEVELPVAAADLEQVDLSSNPRVILRADPSGRGGSWTGRIVRSGGQLDPATRMLPLIARVERPFDAPPPLVPLTIGQFVHATIEGRTMRGVITIPRAALRAGNSVIVVDQTNRISFRPVGVARLTRDSAIIAAGLAPGETIVLSALEAPVEGMSVRTIADRASTLPVESAQ